MHGVARSAVQAASLDANEIEKRLLMRKFHAIHGLYLVYDIINIVVT
jgi:hypothetical protein